MIPDGVQDIARKERIEHDGKALLEINLCCPSFLTEETVLCDRINRYYEESLDAFYSFCKEKFSRVFVGKGVKRKGGAVMKWCIPFASENALSVLIDVSLYDGKKRSSERYVQNWMLPECTPLRAKDAFDTSRKALVGYIDIIRSKTDKREGGFSYLRDAQRLAARNFRKDNFYLTPNGVAFYYDKGIITDASCKEPVFIIPYDKVCGLKIDTHNIGVPIVK